MRPDFAAFILSHGRPDRVLTYDSLRRAGYTGRIYVVIDDEDKRGPEYRERFGDEVLTFSKRAIAAAFDEGDNFEDRRSVFYARNACFGLAAQVGCRFFVQLDDDYSGFYFRWNSARTYGQWRLRKTLDDCLGAMVEFLDQTPALSAIAMAQGGDHIGGGASPRWKNTGWLRKCMNSFVCSVERPFKFVGRINEDVNTYVAGGRRGLVFLTIPAVQLNQLATQSNAGGMTELYLSAGTYVKSFYTVMYAPSATRIAELSDPRSPHVRIHHLVDWRKATPCIVRESLRKP